MWLPESLQKSLKDRIVKDFLKFHLRHNFLLEKEIKKIEKYFLVDSLEKNQNEAFLKMINAAKKTKFYPKFYERNEIDIHQIQSLDDLKKLPILQKKHIKENPSAFLSDTKKILKAKGYTSGSTGSPLMVYRDYRSILNENAYVWWYRQRAGLDIQDKKVSLRGDLDRSKLFYFDKTANTLFISSYHLNREKLPQIVDKICQFQPKALLAYPSSAFTLAGLLEETNKELNIPLVFTSSESLLTFQREKIEQNFKANIYDWYGTAERTIALYSEGNKYYEPPLYSVNEYLEDSVISTSFINTIFPLIRYQVNDVVQHQNKFNKKHKSIEIDKITGRIEDYVRLPDGSRIGRLDIAFKNIEGIKKAQIIQYALNYIKVSIVINEAKFSNKDRLLQNLQKRLGKDVKIKIDIIKEAELQQTDNKKFKFVISKIS